MVGGKGGKEMLRLLCRIVAKAIDVLIRVLVGPKELAGSAQSQQRIGLQLMPNSPIRVPIHQCINPWPHRYTLASASQNQPRASVQRFSSLKPLRRSRRAIETALNL